MEYWLSTALAGVSGISSFTLQGGKWVPHSEVKLVQNVTQSLEGSDLL